jgi:hypothetical protein
MVEEKQMVPARVENPFVLDTECFVVLSVHHDTAKSTWQGPFKTKDEAQRAAAQWMIQRNWLACSVFQLVGTMAKPTPDIVWHDTRPAKPTG